MTKPRVNRYREPSEQERAQSQKVGEEYRSKWAQRLEAQRPWKEACLRVGPSLRSVEAALDCRCSCHPTVDIELHAGGSDCTCQDVTPELKAARKKEAQEALTSLQSMWDTPEHHERERAEKAAVEAAAQAHGVQLKSWGGAAPFQMEGVVDGLSFYVRERHQSYRIHVAPPEHPLHFVEGDGRLGQGDIVIADGGEEDLYDGEDEEAANAVVNTARAVRDYQRRAGCSHILTNEKGTIQFRFCPICGIRAEDVTGFVQ